MRSVGPWTVDLKTDSGMKCGHSFPFEAIFLSSPFLLFSFGIFLYSISLNLFLSLSLSLSLSVFLPTNFLSGQFQKLVRY